MTIRARVAEEPMFGTIRVFLIDDDTGMVFGRNRQWTREEIPAGAMLPEGAAIVELNYQWYDLVLKALNEHASQEKAPGDAYALRRDLDHEKDRVDKLIDFALEAARTPPMQTISLDPRS